MPKDFITNGFRIGDNVAVKIVESTTYYEITHMDPILYVDTHAALAAGATEAYAEVSNLDPPVEQLYQFIQIILVRGNVKVYVKQPASTNRFGTNKSPDGGYLTDEYDEMPLNLFCMEDYPPNVQIVNGTLASITPRLRWHGYRYQLKKLEGRPATFTPIRIGGIGN